MRPTFSGNGYRTFSKPLGETVTIPLVTLVSFLHYTHILSVTLHTSLSLSLSLSLPPATYLFLSILHFLSSPSFYLSTPSSLLASSHSSHLLLSLFTSLPPWHCFLTPSISFFLLPFSRLSYTIPPSLSLPSSFHHLTFFPSLSLTLSLSLSPADGELGADPHLLVGARGNLPLQSPHRFLLLDRQLDRILLLLLLVPLTYLSPWLLPP